MSSESRISEYKVTQLVYNIKHCTLKFVHRFKIISESDYLLRTISSFIILQKPFKNTYFVILQEQRFV